MKTFKNYLKTDTKQPQEFVSKAGAGEWIKDFQKSDNPKFAGKSQDKRKQMALAAYYAKQLNEEVEIDEGTDLKKVPTHKLQAMWDKHKDEERPAPTFAAHLKRINTELVSRKKKGMKEEVEQVDEVSMQRVQAVADRAKSFMKGSENEVDTKKFNQMNAAQKLARKKLTGTAKVPATEEVKEDLAVPLVGSNDDESAEMAKTQLRALANKALHLAMQLTDDQVVEPWVQSKIAVAKDYVTAVHDYMLYGDKEPEKEQTSPYEGGIDPTSGTVRNTFPSFSADVNTGRVV